MKVFIDTNVIISAILNPQGTPYKAFAKAVTSPNQGIICQQNVEELHRIFQKKFPSKLPALQKFFENVTPNLKIISTSQIELAVEKEIRDIKDRPILRSAIETKADVLLTGDKDFLESDCKNIQIYDPAKFMLIN